MNIKTEFFIIEIRDWRRNAGVDKACGGDEGGYIRGGAERLNKTSYKGEREEKWHRRVQKQTQNPVRWKAQRPEEGYM